MTLPIPTAPPTPDSSDPEATFDAMYQARMDWEKGSLAPGLNEAVSIVNAAVPAAVASAAAAQSAAASAIATSGVANWASGTYADGARARSTVDMQVYQKIGTGSSTADPSVGAAANPPTWRLAGLDIATGMPSAGRALTLDFLAGAPSMLGTAYQCTGGGTRVNEAGLIEPAPANVPRFDHSPVSRACLGLLMETTSTNLIVHCRDFTQAAWTKTRCTVSTGTVLAPDGSAAQKLVEDTSNNTHSVTQTVAAASNTWVSRSIYARAAERTQIQLHLSNGVNFSITAVFDLNTGAVLVAPTDNADFSGSLAYAEEAGNGWWRLVLIAFKNAVNTTVQPYTFMMSGGAASYAGDGTSGVYVWGDQLELLPFPTSLILTGSTTASRGAESVSLPLGFATERATLLADVTLHQRGTGAVAASDNVLLSDASNASNLQLRTLRTGAGVSIDATASVAGVVTLDAPDDRFVVPGERIVHAVSAGRGAVAYARNGSLIQSAGMPAAAAATKTLLIGGTGVQAMRVRGIAVWADTLPTVHLIAATAI